MQIKNYKKAVTNCQDDDSDFYLTLINYYIFQNLINKGPCTECTQIVFRWNWLTIHVLVINEEGKVSL